MLITSETSLKMEVANLKSNINEITNSSS